MIGDRAALLLAIGACGGAGARPPPDAGGAADAACAFPIEIGHEEGDAFVPYADGDNAEIACEFQAIFCLNLALRVGGSEAGSARIAGTAFLAGFDPSTLAAEPTLPEATGGPRVITDLALPLPAPMPRMIDKRVDLWIRVDAGGCAGSEARWLVLVNRFDSDGNPVAPSPDGGP